MSEKIKLKITFNKVLSDDSFDDKLILIDKEKFDKITQKPDFVSLLIDSNIPFPICNDANYLKFTRKSKKNKGYIDLESLEDFKCLSRSLNVKNHIKLVINDHSPVSTQKLHNSSKSKVNTGSTEIRLDDLSALAELFTDVTRDKFKEIIGDFTNEILNSFKSTAPINGSTESEMSSKKEAIKSKAAKPDTIHPNTACDNCSPNRFVPIHGVRYKCLMCEDYDLCQNCQDSFSENEITTSKHSYLHATMRIVNPENFKVNHQLFNYLPSSKIVHNSIYCDKCDQGPIEGTRYKCLICNNYDLCNTCYDHQIFSGINYGNHQHEHQMEEIKEPVKCSYPCINVNNHRSCPAINVDEDIKFSSKGKDDILDINLDNTSKSVSNKIKSILSEFGVGGFLSKLEKIFEDSERYNNLLDLIDCETNEEDVKYALLTSLIYLNQEKSNQSNTRQEEVTKEDAGNNDKAIIVDSQSMIENQFKSLDESYEIDNWEVSKNLILNSKSELVHSSNSIILKTKRYGPNSKIFSILLTNNSNHAFPPSDLIFEFLDEVNNNKDSIIVKNANSIDIHRTRFYNLKGNLEKFIGKKIRILVNNDDFFMQGRFLDLESESTLDVLKLSTDINAEAKVETKSEDKVKTREEDLSIDIVLKSNGMVQLTIFNNTNELIDCSDLSIEIYNFLDNLVSKVLVHKRHGIESYGSSKFNISLNSGHLKHPFKVILNNGKFKASAELNINKLSSNFNIEYLNKEVKDLIDVSDTEFISATETVTETNTEIDVDSNRCLTEELNNESNTEIEDFNDVEIIESNEGTSSFSSSSLGSNKSMVLPSLPKESIHESNSDYVNNKQINDNVDMLIDLENSEIVSENQDEEDNEFDLGSDYEILTPSTSNYH